MKNVLKSNLLSEKAKEAHKVATSLSPAERLWLAAQLMRSVKQSKLVIKL